MIYTDINNLFAWIGLYPFRFLTAAGTKAVGLVYLTPRIPYLLGQHHGNIIK